MSIISPCRNGWMVLLRGTTVNYEIRLEEAGPWSPALQRCIFFYPHLSQHRSQAKASSSFAPSVLNGSDLGCSLLPAHTPGPRISGIITRPPSQRAKGKPRV